MQSIQSNDSRRADKARTTLRDSLVASAEVFAAKPFFLSDEFTLVDASIAPILWRLRQYGIELPSEAAAVEAYGDSIFERDAFRRRLTELEMEMR